MRSVLRPNRRVRLPVTTDRRDRCTREGRLRATPRRCCRPPGHVARRCPYSQTEHPARRPGHLPDRHQQLPGLRLDCQRPGLFHCLAKSSLWFPSNRRAAREYRHPSSTRKEPPHSHQGLSRLATLPSPQGPMAARSLASEGLNCRQGAHDVHTGCSFPGADRTRLDNIRHDRHRLRLGQRRGTCLSRSHLATQPEWSRRILCAGRVSDCSSPTRQ